MPSKQLAYQLAGGAPYGFRLQGGDGAPFVVSKIRPASKAEAVGLLEGDVIVAINGIKSTGLGHGTATALTELDESLLTLHILRGPGARSDIDLAEDSLKSQLVNLTEAEAVALVASRSPSQGQGRPDPGVGCGRSWDDADSVPVFKLQAPPAARQKSVDRASLDRMFRVDGSDYRPVVEPPSMTMSLSNSPSTAYSRNEQSFNDDGTERRIVEETETQNFGGTTLTKVTKREYSTFSSGNPVGSTTRTGTNPVPRITVDNYAGDPFQFSSFHDDDGRGGWMSEDVTKKTYTRREESDGYRQPAVNNSSWGNNPGANVSYSVEPIPASSISNHRKETNYYSGIAEPDFEQSRPAVQRTVTRSWQQQQQQQESSAPGGSYYEAAPGQSVVLPGFTISIEAARGPGSRQPAHQPLVTVTPSGPQRQEQDNNSWTDGWQQTRPQRPTPTERSFPPTGSYDIRPPDHEPISFSTVTPVVESTAEFLLSEESPQWQPVQVRVMGSTGYGAAGTGPAANYQASPAGDGSWYQPVTSQQVGMTSHAKQNYVDYGSRNLIGQYGSDQNGGVDNVQVSVGSQPHFVLKGRSESQRSEVIGSNRGFNADRPEYFGRQMSLNEPSRRDEQPPYFASSIQSPPPPSDRPQYGYSGQINQTNQNASFPATSTAPFLPRKLPLNPSFRPNGETEHQFNQPPESQPQLYQANRSASPKFASEQDYMNQKAYNAANYYNAPQETSPVQGQYYGTDGYPPSYQQLEQQQPADTWNRDAVPSGKPLIWSPPSRMTPAAPAMTQWPGMDRSQQMRPQQQQQQQQPWSSAGQVAWPGREPDFPQQSGHMGYNPAAGLMDESGYNSMSSNASPSSYAPPAPPLPSGPLPPAPPPPVQAPPPPPPPPTNPYKVYGITAAGQTGNDPDTKAMVNKVQLANTVAHSVMAPENVNSRGQQMFLRRQQNSHKWTSGPAGGDDDEPAVRSPVKKAPPPDLGQGQSRAGWGKVGAGASSPAAGQWNAAPGIRQPGLVQRSFSASGSDPASFGQGPVIRPGLVRMQTSVTEASPKVQRHHLPWAAARPPGSQASYGMMAAPVGYTDL